MDTTDDVAKMRVHDAECRKKLPKPPLTLVPENSAERGGEDALHFFKTCVVAEILAFDGQLLSSVNVVIVCINNRRQIERGRIPH